MNSKGFLSTSYSARLSSPTSPFRKSKASTPPSSPSSPHKAPAGERFVPNPLSQSITHAGKNSSSSLSKSTSAVRRRLLFEDSDDDSAESEKCSRQASSSRNSRGSPPDYDEIVIGSENDPVTDYENLCDVLIYHEVFGKGHKSVSDAPPGQKKALFSEIPSLEPSGHDPSKDSLALSESDSGDSARLSSDKSFFSHGPVSEETMMAISAAYARPSRPIPTAPEKVLYAPGVVNDFYLDPLTWSKDNVVAITLESGVHILNIETGVSSCVAFSDSFETSLAFSPSDPSILAVGTDSGSVTLYDIQDPSSPCPLESWAIGPDDTVEALGWSPSGNSLACGTKNGLIGLLDSREHHTPVHLFGDSPKSSCRRDVCGLKWNPQGTLVVSGDGDGLVTIWDVRDYSSPLKIFAGHKSTVRALAWSPHAHGQLVSGGGTADKTIRFWDTNTLSSLGKINVGSQVCGLHWSSLANEIVSTHGFSQNHVKIWDAKTRGCVAVLCGHTSRILNFAVSPDERKILTGSPDERLCFWNLYPAAPTSLNDSFR